MNFCKRLKSALILFTVRRSRLKLHLLRFLVYCRTCCRANPPWIKVLWFSPNSITSICCGFLVQRHAALRDVQQICN